MNTGFGHFTTLADDECRDLLRTHTIARIGWESSVGPQVIPVTYRVDGDTVVFRTAPGSILAELRTGARVVVQIDEFDTETRTGWSVMARGTASSPTDPDALVGLWSHDGPAPWAGNDRNLFIVVAIEGVSGRIVASED
ncbi:pyridoxamine 5'-phosphate oxidase family protein [Mariniluteicoccus flavus]